MTRATACLALLLVTSLPAQPAASDTERRAIDAVLDSFHDAAAKADGERYFGHFAPDGIFLGSDATERWTVPEFREWSKKYFERESAWVFVPRNRFVMFNPDKTLAWFDEITRSEHMGDCRGTGALRKIDGTWRIAHYSLTVLIPNDVMDRVAAVVRSYEKDPKSAENPAAGETTIYLVRHAEKGEGKDPSLTEHGRARAEALARMLAHTKISAVYSTEYKRTSETVAPVAKAAGIQPTVVGGRRLNEQVKLLKTKHRGQHVVVAGHSNTVPMILRKLGATKRVSLTDDDYGDLFIVRLRAIGPPTVLRLAFGQ